MPKRSALALAVLTLLDEAPMHPYRMQQLITLRGKDQVVNVSQRASLYTTIERLRREGLVRVAETERQGQRPERSIYEITDEGRATAREWMTGMLSAPKRDYPEFLAALAHVPLLEPAETAHLLRIRREHIAAEAGEIRAELAGVAGFLPRVLLLDTELRLRTRSAELEFLEDVLADLDSGGMAWSRESLELLAKTHEPKT